MTAQHRTLIVVADRQIARFFHHSHAGAPLEPHGPDIEHPSEGDRHSDRPGRSFDSFGHGRHAVEPTTSYQTEERHSIATAINQRVRQAFDADEVDRLALLADPKLLGELRQTLDERLRAHVVLELDDHLTQADPSDLARRLTKDGAIGLVRE